MFKAFQILTACTAVVLLTQAAQAQHHGHHPQGAQHKGAPAGAAEPGPVRMDGAFRAMIHKQDYAPRVSLGAIIKSGATDAVGAVSGLRGEITAIDGQFIVSYGKPCTTCPEVAQEDATLLASAQVEQWLPPLALPSDLAGEALDRYIIAQARAVGLNVERAFPVRMKGDLTGVKMHIIAAPNPKFAGHGSDHGMAEQQEIAAARIAGDVVGFYAPPAAQGIITHPGEPFHFHWVDPDRTKTAHLDAFGMAQGAQLFLPRPDLRRLSCAP
jgi:alpha-acetolactate decarboxylase